MSTTFSAPQRARYSSPARLLHWLTVVLVLTTIPAGLVMVQDGLERSVQDALFLYHKNIGPVILIVVLLRLLVRAVRPPPPLPASLPRLQALAAEAVHWLLYLCLVTMALSGIVRVQAGGFPMELWDPIIGGVVPRDKAVADTAMALHSAVRYLLVVLIALHVGAAAMHGLIRRDGIFSRMWPPV